MLTRASHRRIGIIGRRISGTENWLRGANFNEAHGTRSGGGREVRWDSVGSVNTQYLTKCYSATFQQLNDPYEYVYK